jgi:hypothetical protein
VVFDVFEDSGAASPLVLLQAVSASTTANPPAAICTLLLAFMVLPFTWLQRQRPAEVGFLLLYGTT